MKYTIGAYYNGDNHSTVEMNKTIHDECYISAVGQTLKNILNGRELLDTKSDLETIIAILYTEENSPTGITRRSACNFASILLNWTYMLPEAVWEIRIVHTVN